MSSMRKVQRLDGDGCLYLIKAFKVESTPWGNSRKHYGEWLQIWNELTQTAGHALGYANMVGHTPELTGLTTNSDTATTSVTVPEKTLYVPLQFWFRYFNGKMLKRVSEPKSTSPVIAACA